MSKIAKNASRTFTVDGMHCTACAMLIREALEDAGAKDLAVTLDAKNERGTVTFTSDLPDDRIKELIENEGEYTVR